MFRNVNISGGELNMAVNVRNPPWNGSTRKMQNLILKNNNQDSLSTSISQIPLNEGTGHPFSKI